MFSGACAVGFLTALQANNRLLMLLLGTAGLARLLTPWDHKIKIKAQLLPMPRKKFGVATSRSGSTMRDFTKRSRVCTRSLHGKR